MILEVRFQFEESVSWCSFGLMKQLTEGGQVMIVGSHGFRTPAHRDNWGAHSYNGLGFNLEISGSGKFAIVMEGQLDDGIWYWYPTQSWGSEESAEAMELTLASFYPPGWTTCAIGEAFNYWVRPQVIGKFTGPQWHDYQASH